MYPCKYTGYLLLQKAKRGLVCSQWWNVASRLGGNGEKVYMEFDPRLPRSQTKIRVHNDRESMELKKCFSKTGSVTAVSRFKDI